MEKFNSALKGYNIEEVNSFVDRMTDEYSKLLDKVKSKDSEIAALQSEIERLKKAQDNFSGSFTTLDYEYSKEYLERARNEARTIIDDAKKNASRIVNDALLEAERTEMQAERLRRNIVVFKRRMRANLQVQLQSIEDMEDIKLED